MAMLHCAGRGCIAPPLPGSRALGHPKTQSSPYQEVLKAGTKCWSTDGKAQEPRRGPQHPGWVEETATAPMAGLNSTSSSRKTSPQPHNHLHPLSLPKRPPPQEPVHPRIGFPLVPSPPPPIAILLSLKPPHSNPVTPPAMQQLCTHDDPSAQRWPPTYLALGHGASRRLQAAPA